MSRTSTLYSDHISEVSFHSVEKCKSSLSHKIERLKSIKGNNSARTNISEKKNMSRTSTLYSDHMYEVSFHSLKNCGSSLSHKIERLKSIKGNNSARTNISEKKNMSRTSTLYSDHMYEVSFHSLKKCGSSLSHKILSTDGRTDRQTDGQADSSIPPYNFVVGV